MLEILDDVPAHSGCRGKKRHARTGEERNATPIAFGKFDRSPTIFTVGITDNPSDYASPEMSFDAVRPLFHRSSRLSAFIAGPPGAGKSYAAAFMIKMRKMECPSRSVLLVTDLEGDDASLKGVEMTKIRPDILEAMTLERVREHGGADGVILLFDDVDAIVEKKRRDVVIRLAHKMLMDGRDHSGRNHHIDIIITSHSVNDYRNTKYAIENCEWAVVFPRKTLRRQLETFAAKIGISFENPFFRNTEYGAYIHKFPPFYALNEKEIITL